MCHSWQKENPTHAAIQPITHDTILPVPVKSHRGSRDTTVRHPGGAGILLSVHVFTPRKTQSKLLRNPVRNVKRNYRKTRVFNGTHVRHGYRVFGLSP